MPQRLLDWPQQARIEAPNGDRDTDSEILGGDEYRDRKHDRDTIQEGRRRIEEQPDPLAPRGEELPEILRSEDVSLEQVAPVARCPLRQIRDFQNIGKNIVAVITKERIAVEEHGRDPGDQHDTVGQRPDKSFLDRKPHVERQRGDEDFHDHAGGADKCAPPFVAEFRCSGGVDVGHRRENEKHHAEFVHRPPNAFTT